MPNIDAMATEVARRIMILFFVIDTSSSMMGDKITAVNNAIRETIPELKNMTNADAKIKIAVLDFASGAEWQSPQPIELDDFSWHDLQANGLTDLGEACEMLNEKLSRKAFMNNAVGNYAPAIVLISDGYPTDNYKKGLDLLNKNNWFKQSIRVALAVGSDYDRSILAEFTGNDESVIEIHKKSMLMKIIKFVSVRASQIASRSSIVSEEKDNDIPQKNKQFIESLKDIDELNNISIDDIDDDVEFP